ncbi:MAG TPA: SMP-30/gluconolactonase/LRE family protein [Solirubrobacteraceae bacterium]|nr:SMP-30/gluconolactonase/LRE family protein [Solirubrobacteraceae bacterium]
MKLADVDAHEGPVVVDGGLFFTTLAGAIKRLDLGDGSVEVVRADGNRPNGMALGACGMLVVCEQGTFATAARIAKVDPRTGEAETLVDSCDGAPLNSPNDVVVARDGTLFFTDPSYGHLQGFRPPPQAPDAVYRVRDGVAERVAVGFDKPNGIALSPDERTLYVSDNGAPHHLLALEGGARRVVHVGTPEHPDGVKVAPDGRIFVSAAHGVQVLAPDGGVVDEIPLPGAVNFALDGDVLFITTDTAVWAAEL